MYNKKWYDGLKKSPYTPPDKVFSFVWIILYIFIILSFYLVWKNKKCYPYCNALSLFIIQFILNLSWTTIFFKYKRVKLAFLVILFIFIISCITFYYFYLISPKASYLLIPYIIWLLFAMYLNIYIILKNKHIY